VAADGGEIVKGAGVEKEWRELCAGSPLRDVCEALQPFWANVFAEEAHAAPRHLPAETFLRLMGDSGTYMHAVGPLCWPQLWKCCGRARTTTFSSARATFWGRTTLRRQQSLSST